MSEMTEVLAEAVAMSLESQCVMEETIRRWKRLDRPG